MTPILSNKASIDDGPLRRPLPLPESPKTPTMSGSRFRNKSAMSSVNDPKNPLSRLNKDKDKDKKVPVPPAGLDLSIKRPTEAALENITSEKGLREEVEKWRIFGKMMAESYEDLNKRYLEYMSEKEKDRKVINALKDQVKFYLL